MSNQYPFYNGLSIADIRKAFPMWAEDFVQAAFKNWEHTFCKRASFLYRSRLTMQYDYLMQRFGREYNISINDGIDPDYDHVWQEYLSNTGYPEHKAEFDNWTYYTEEMQRRNRGNTLNVITDTDAMQDFLRLLLSDEPQPDSDVTEMLIMRVWFNKCVNNPSDDVGVLRRMPYPEYLKSDHWRRVRGAMLIAHSARCQGVKCEGFDSYWMGSEDYLHVHHVSYRNRGCERFEDLRLICKDCHEDAHKGKDVFADYEHDLYKLMVEVGHE